MYKIANTQLVLVEENSKDKFHEVIKGKIKKGLDQGFHDYNISHSINTESKYVNKTTYSAVISFKKYKVIIN